MDVVGNLDVRLLFCVVIPTAFARKQDQQFRLG